MHRLASGEGGLGGLHGRARLSATNAATVTPQSWPLRSLGSAGLPLRWAPLAPAIDIVIPTSGHYELTQECLAHLARQTRSHTVIVSDNGGGEETAERVADEWPAVRLIRSQKNLSFAAACNRGVEQGEGEVVVLLNNDVYCHPEWLERLVAPLEAEPTTGSVACLLAQPGERLIDSVGLTADSTLAGFPRLAGQPIARAREERPALI
ncbi:MAG: glycosyltransferase, partial [Solirubrobacteraceae bacterium]